MISFRAMLVLLWAALATYTAATIARHGLNLLPIFFGDMATMAWPGQFNLDFLCFLLLSATWVLWRNGYSAANWLLAILAFFGGAGFLLPYLLFLTFRTNGDPKKILLGRHA